MHDYLLWILIVVLFSLIGLGFAKLILNYFEKYKRYAVLASLFFLILIISELMKEGFAAVGSWAAISLILGAIFPFALKKFYNNDSILFKEFPKLIGLAASYAIAVDLGQAIAILFALHYIPRGGLIAIKHSLKELVQEQFKFVILGMIAFVVFSALTFLIRAHIITFSAGMMLFIVIEEGFLKRK